MTGPEVGPSMADLIEQATAALDNAARPLLAQAVRQTAGFNRQLTAQVEELTGLLGAATQAGEAYAGMYRLAAENAEHYQDVLRRIAKAASLEDAQQIAIGALS